MTAPNLTSPAPEALQGPLVCIGGGTMASAVVLGGLSAGALDAARVSVADHSESKLDAFKEAGCTVAPSAAAMLAGAPADAVVLLAIKPQSLGGLAKELAGLVGERTVLSMLAGVSTSQVRAALGGRCPIVRTMPNTPAMLGMGVTGIVAGEGVSDADLAITRTLFEAVGTVHMLADESHMPTFTLLSGSGPAYVFYLAEALEQGALELGLPAGQARAITAEMIAGASALLTQSDKSPIELRASVTSKAGVTAAAIGELDRVHVMESFSKALAAGVARDAELATGAGRA